MLIPSGGLSMIPTDTTRSHMLTGADEFASSFFAAYANSPGIG